MKTLSEQTIKEYLAKNPQISTDDVYISSFWNEKEFVMLFGHGELRNFNNLYVRPKNQNWCFSVCPFAVFYVAKTQGSNFYLAKKKDNKYFKITDLYHYKTASPLFKIEEILFLKKPIVTNLKTAKDYWNKTRRQDEKELYSLAQKIEKEDKISFGELVIAQNLINHLEHHDLKIYNYITYGRFNEMDFTK